LQALTAGALGLAISGQSAAEGQPSRLGSRPDKMPAGRSIYTLRGEVIVNGRTATRDTVIPPGSTVQTGDASRVIFVVDKDAFYLRSNSRLEIADQPSGSSGITRSLRLLGGKLLSVFGSPRHRMSTPLMTLGIRGTGVYLESEPDFDYVCTCYGETLIESVKDPSSVESIATTHHDAPRYVLAEGDKGQLIKPAPFKNHTDEELALIEALVGRTPPFSIPGSYSAPRRPY
ncbi:MAG: hypothetical protein VW985_13210, partial [Gammaproteobacteria bacterium]